MGGLRRHLPVTYWTYLFAALAISGAPLTAGFFSKDRILSEVYSSGSIALWTVGWITAGLTAFYMFRQFFLVFHGSSRVPEAAKSHVHESPRLMTVPLIVLALGSIFAGWLATPEFMWGSAWDRWLGPVLSAPKAEHHAVSEELFLMALTIAIGAAGIYLAFVLYGRESAAAARIEAGAIYRWLADKYYVDELYGRLFVRPFTAFSAWLARRFDPGFVDGIVNGVASVTVMLARVAGAFDTYVVDGIVFGFLTGALLLFAYFLRW